jgi:hypothetical protein
VRLYAYDPERRERRHRVIAAFDNEQEFIALIHSNKGEIDRRRSVGEELSALEDYLGVALEPGYRRHGVPGRGHDQIADLWLAPRAFTWPGHYSCRQLQTLRQ